MNMIQSFIDGLKRAATPKVAISIPRPCAGTTNYLRWLGWKEKYPEAEFTSYKGLFLMTTKSETLK